MSITFFGCQESLEGIYIYTSIKNISFKMLKDVGMVVPKIKETRL